MCKIGQGLLIIGVIGMLITSFIAIMAILDDEWKTHKKYVFILLAISLIPLFIGIITPSKKELAVIYFMPKVINNEQIATTGNKGLEALNSIFDKWVKDTLNNDNRFLILEDDE
jgi:hypothetical protein